MEPILIVNILAVSVAYVIVRFYRSWLNAAESEIARLQADLTASQKSQRRLEGNVGMLDRRVHELIEERDGLNVELDKVRGIAAIVAPKRGPNGRFMKRQKAPAAA